MNILNLSTVRKWRILGMVSADVLVLYYVVWFVLFKLGISAVYMVPSELPLIGGLVMSRWLDGLLLMILVDLVAFLYLFAVPALVRSGRFTLDEVSEGIGFGLVAGGIVVTIVVAIAAGFAGCPVDGYVFVIAVVLIFGIGFGFVVGGIAGGIVASILCGIAGGIVVGIAGGGIVDSIVVGIAGGGIVDSIVVGIAGGGTVDSIVVGIAVVGIVAGIFAGLVDSIIGGIVAGIFAGLVVGIAAGGIFAGLVGSIAGAIIVGIVANIVVGIVALAKLIIKLHKKVLDRGWRCKNMITFSCYGLLIGSVIIYIGAIVATIPTKQYMVNIILLYISLPLILIAIAMLFLSLLGLFLGSFSIVFGKIIKTLFPRVL